MNSNTLLLCFVCVAFPLINNACAKLEVVIALVQEPSGVRMNKRDYHEMFNSGYYLATKYRHLFNLSVYEDKDLNVTSASGRHKCRKAGLLFKAGLQLKYEDRHKNHSEERLKKDIGEMDNKYTLYRTNKCQAFIEAFIDTERLECTKVLTIEQLYRRLLTPVETVSDQQSQALSFMSGMFRNMHFDRKLKRLSGGRMVSELIKSIRRIQNITEKAAKSKPTKDRLAKVFVYVLPPDFFTVMVLSMSPPGTQYNGTEIEDTVDPGLGAMYVIEIRSPDERTQDWTAKFQYTNGNRNLLQAIRLPSCGLRCPIYRVYSLLEPYAVTEQGITQACNARPSKAE